MSLSDLSSGEIKAIKEFIDEIPDSKIMPEGTSGTLYPPSKDQKVGGWRYDEQGFTTRKLAYNLQIQVNTKGVSIPNAMLRDVEMTMISFMQGARGVSALMILVSSYGVKNGTITVKVMRTALHTALTTTPRKIYVTHDGHLITDPDAFQKGEAKVAPDEEKKGKKGKCE